MKRLFRLRTLAWLFATLVTLYCLFVAIENWTGARALAAAKAKLAQEGETLDFASLLPPPIPDAQNFCAIEPLRGLTNPKNKIAPELEVLKTLRLPSAGRASSPVLDLQPVFAALVKAGIGQDGLSAREMLAALDTVHPVVARLARNAAERPQALFVPQLGEGQEHFTLLEMQLPHYMPAQNLARHLAVRARLASAAGNTAEAVRSIQGCLRLATAAGAEPVLISTLVSVSMYVNIQEAVRALLHAHTATAAELEVLAEELRRVDYLRVMLLAARGELAASTQTMEVLFTRAESPFSLLVAGGQAAEATLFERWLWCLIPTGLLQHWEAKVIDLEMRHMIRPLKRGGTAALLQELEQCEKDIAASRELWNPHGWMAGLMMPSYSSVLRRVYFTESQRRLTLAAIEVEKHRLAHGALPATLDSPLLDPIDQKPLRYRVENAGYVLWSVALDGEDDQGRSLEKDENETDASFAGDWVWRMVR